jgi:muramoyltetrapeptide carboxypeptidase
MAHSTLKPRSIRLLGPSGYPNDPEAIRRALARFGAQGHRVSGKAVLDRRDLRFAGSDAERAADFDALCEVSHPLPDIVLAVRGGYGAHPLLPMLDYAALGDRLRDAPVAIVGHSDFTALQCALYAKSGIVTFGGPMLGPDFGAPELDAFTWEHFWHTLGQDEGVAEWVAPEAADMSAEGTLWGGNLAMLGGLVGSPYFPAIDGGLLFIEDIAEPPYRVERMLYHLLHAGVLGRQKAQLAGDFTGYRVAEYDNGYDVDIALDRVAQAAGIPVVRGLPFGHGPAKFTLPFGAAAHLSVADGRAVLRFSGHPRPKTP